MLRFIGWLLNLGLGIFGLAVIAHFVLSIVKPSTTNKWIELVNSIVEPVLQPVRKLLTTMFNARFDKFDWSHIVLLVFLHIATTLIGIIFR